MQPWKKFSSRMLFLVSLLPTIENAASEEICGSHNRAVKFLSACSKEPLGLNTGSAIQDFTESARCRAKMYTTGEHPGSP